MIKQTQDKNILIEEGKMSIINKLKNFIIDPGIRMGYLNKIGFYRRMTDEKYLKKKFKTVFKSDLNLDNPQTFNEKLQWLKLYDRKLENTKSTNSL